MIYDQKNKLLDSFHNFTRCFSMFASYIYIYIYIELVGWVGMHCAILKIGGLSGIMNP